MFQAVCPLMICLLSFATMPSKGQTITQNSTCPSKCSCLPYASVECNQQDIQDISWNFPSSMRRLSLRHNQINDLPLPPLKESLETLHHLDLSQNNLTLPPTTLQSLHGLASLNLSHNSIKFDRFRRDVFSMNTKLEILDLSHNKLNFVADFHFMTLVNLKVLHLDGNQLPHIGFHYFIGNPKLTTLTARDNLISLLSLFPRQQHLSSLDLRKNTFQFTNFSQDFRGTPYIRTLKLGHRGLQYFPSTFSGLKFLGSLELEEYSQRELTTDLLKHARYVRSIAMKGGSLERLALNGLVYFNTLSLSDMANMTSLTLMMCRQLSDVTIQDAPELSVVRMERLGLTEFNSTKILPYPNKINKLLVRGNWFNVLRESTFNNLPHVEVMDFGSNRIAEIKPGVFSQLVMLKSLDLSGNLLHSFDPSHLQSKNLFYLGLARNFISTFSPSDFSSLHSLKSVNLSYNEITTLPQLETSSILYILHANKWNCTCKLYDIMRLSTYRDACQSNASSSCYPCTYPSKYAGRTVFEIGNECSSAISEDSYSSTALQPSTVIALAAGAGGMLATFLLVLIACRLGYFCKNSENASSVAYKNPGYCDENELKMPRTSSNVCVVPKS